MGDTGIQDDWSTDSNEAVHVSLVTPGQTLHTFHPKFTYPIFGDEERIFGYQGLKINIKYHVCDMRPVVQITYNRKFKPVGETEPTDLKAILEDFLPKTAFEKTAVFDAAIADPSYTTWKPPGELWKTIQSGSQTLEVWKGSLADMAVQQMVKRMQILVPFFIEGGTMIELREPEWSLDRWTVFFLYQKNVVDVGSSSSPYTFMGYSTVYRYFLYQPIAPSGSAPAKKQPIHHEANLDFKLPLPEVPFSSLPCRSRISQFIILPPFQGGGSGSRFYNAIFDYFLKDPTTIEITVEDPNEAFDDLRDINDLARLRTVSKFSALRINKNSKPRSKGPVPRDIVDMDAMERIRSKMKIAPRQFARVTEMQLLSMIPLGVRQSLIDHPKSSIPDLAAKEHEYHLWQLWVKKRLYRHNKDMLMQLDRAERIQKLEEVTGGVEADYARLLRNFEQRARGSAHLTTSNGKRSSSDDTEENDNEPPAKRAKLAS
ncbi:Acyl-CoA N-acyltransferases (Nat) [Venustampulla echinocandica]|uniref:Histone acetyltransferase type B catalytic subunit n=1 Tax=Venustampulla echinocandica TaxID=2656787 RepID=A0A370TPC1_9HELO|nr:Acyl-CoA N-acyltransferases (Nat) [Venustampulla echinocandica]RDL37380.1 Acyl-CoA N-acyltransferases (Nat) [Venustampulla echinocandica]